MNTIKINKSDALMIAHRGLSGIETENTNAAFVAAGNRSFYGIETDIHRTSDGRFVASHDCSLGRVSGENVNVEEVSLAVSQSVVLFDKDKTHDRLDLRPPTLENYINICKKYEKQCILELKSDFTDEEIQKIIDIIKSFDYLDSVTFISFNYENLLKIRSICPNQSAQYLFSDLTDDILEKLIRDKFDVDIYHPGLTEEIVKLLHNHGILVNVWIVDDKEKAEEFVKWGVDFITTDILE